jgi:hypothetical protein
MESYNIESNIDNRLQNKYKKWEEGREIKNSCKYKVID